MNGIGEKEPFAAGLGELWGEILYSGGGYRVFRWVLVIVLLCGTIWSAFLFREMLDMMRPRETQLPPAKSVVTEESQRLAEEAEAFRGAVLARGGSSQLAVMASRIDRRPFAPGSPPEPEVTEEAGENRQAAGQESVFAGQEQVVPPFIAVQAVMVMGVNRMAVMDIEGESPGKIVKAGTPFGNGLGKVISVSPDHVVISWADKRFEIAVGM